MSPLLILFCVLLQRQTVRYMKHYPFYLRQIGTHEVRQAKTSKGFAYYFDKVGNAYIWCVKGNTKGMLVLQKPSSRLSPCSIATGRGKQGYLFLKSGSGSCYGKNDKGCLLVHRGVAMAFPEICGLPDIFRNQIDHINGDKHDNRACNLRWVSQSENMQARIAMKRAQQSITN